jgi:CheY-like chemotaxis protein
MRSPDQLPLLVVEDSEDDLFFFRRLLAKAGVKSPLAVAMDGQQAVDHLTAAINDGAGARPPVPAVVFLDLKLPLRGGFEVLQWIRTQPALGRTIVLVLSSSAEGRDVNLAYELGAQGYLVKYPEPAVFADVVQRRCSPMSCSASPPCPRTPRPIA